MSIIRKTLEENYIFFVRELARINEEIDKLSKGNISAKKIGKSTYYYHQWREGKQVKSVLLGLESPSDLIKDINRSNRSQQFFAAPDFSCRCRGGRVYR